MAQDYVVLKNRSENGMIAINKQVIHSIARLSLRDIDNAEPADGTLTNAVQVKIEKNRLWINTDIHVLYGANVNATCELVQRTIYDNVLFMTGLKPYNVSVSVEGFEF